MALLRGTTALPLVPLLQLDTNMLTFVLLLSLSLCLSFLVRCMEPATACFLASPPHTSRFPLPDPIPLLATHPAAIFNEFSYDKLFTVVYSHLLCLSAS